MCIITQLNIKMIRFTVEQSFTVGLILVKIEFVHIAKAMHLLVGFATDFSEADLDMNIIKILLICMGLFNF